MERAKRITRDGMDEITRSMSEYGRRQMESINLVSGMTEAGVQARIRQEEKLTEHLINLNEKNLSEMQRLEDRRIEQRRISSQMQEAIDEQQRERDAQSLKEHYAILEAQGIQRVKQEQMNQNNLVEIARVRQRNVERALQIEQQEKDKSYEALKQSYAAQEASTEQHNKNMAEMNQRNADEMARLRSTRLFFGLPEAETPERLAVVDAQRYAIIEKFAEKDEADKQVRIQRAIERDKRYAKEYTALTAKTNADAAQSARMLNAVEEDIAMKRERRIQAAWKMQQRQIEDAQRFREGQAAEQPLGITAGISQKRLAIIREAVKWQEQYNDLQKEAATLLQRLATPEQQHTQRLARYNMMLQENIIDQQQFNAAVQASTKIMQAQQLATTGGFGAMGGAAAQASYAVEDFIQVMAMGGGLNMALMSASNNLSMVARSLIGTGTAMSAMAGSIVPLAIVALASLVNQLIQTKDVIDRIDESLERMRKDFEDIGKVGQLKMQLGFDIQDIREIFDATVLMGQALENNRQKMEAERDLRNQMAKAERERRQIAYDMLGGQEAVTEATQKLNDLIQTGTFEQQSIAQRAKDLMTDVFGASAQGDMATMIDKARTLYEVLESLQQTRPGGGFVPYFLGSGKTFVDGMLGDPAMLDQLQDLFGVGSVDLFKAAFGSTASPENIAALEALQDRMKEVNKELSEPQLALNAILEKEIELRKQIVLAQEQERRDQESKLQMKREEMMFDLQASDLQKDMRRIDQQLMDFIGPFDPTNIIQMQMAQMQGMDFMQAMAADLQKQLGAQNEIPAAQGALFQDAMDAQAEAFKQMAQSEKKNPQLERQIQLLEAIRERIAAGAAIQVVP
jgi:hypothetical protein